jgi:hypothetical protein
MYVIDHYFIISYYYKSDPMSSDKSVKRPIRSGKKTTKSDPIAKLGRLLNTILCAKYIIEIMATYFCGYDKA